jgi:ribosome-associated heat shock protein Hsp15
MLTAAGPSQVELFGSAINSTFAAVSTKWTVIVKAVARNRGPASEAQFLYEETEGSARKRETVSARLKLERPPEFDLPGRPSKKDRRAIQRFTKRGW